MRGNEKNMSHRKQSVENWANMLGCMCVCLCVKPIKLLERSTLKMHHPFFEVWHKKQWRKPQNEQKKGMLVADISNRLTLLPDNQFVLSVSSPALLRLHYGTSIELWMKVANIHICWSPLIRSIQRHHSATILSILLHTECRLTVCLNILPALSSL